jgi:hypothetical protein
LPTAYRLIGATEVATGLLWWPVGAAAAVGLVCLTAGAALTHRRAGDPAANQHVCSSACADRR